mmetsp:Transcript_7727/g.6978  ORF Transcript_7727/g.6978 Transcript_7727/m.6978 type:complete len:167 (+) Transcript_7727:1-501(+)
MAALEEAERGARFLLDIGSECSVYSRSSKRWFDGYISKIFVDQHTNQEWFIVKYGNNKSKRMQRFCTDLKVKVTQQSQQSQYQQQSESKNISISNQKNKLNYNNEDDDNLSDLETDDRISKPMKSTSNKPIIYNENATHQHPIIIFGNDDAESVNLDNLPPIKFRW